jgi:hypothetical protein
VSQNSAPWAGELIIFQMCLEKGMEMLIIFLVFVKQGTEALILFFIYLASSAWLSGNV